MLPPAAAASERKRIRQSREGLEGRAVCKDKRQGHRSHFLSFFSFTIFFLLILFGHGSRRPEMGVDGQSGFKKRGQTCKVKKKKRDSERAVEVRSESSYAIIVFRFVQ